ncbi:MAG: glycoside hydrolase family 95 protein [Parabacteroides johnsonii]|jgi:hypothetical protein
MNKIKIFFLTLIAIPLIAQEEPKTLWFEQPANQWVEALPIGNGQIGAMIFGGVEEELIQLNEGTLWSGSPLKKNVNPEAYKFLAPVREALAKEDYQQATKLCKKMQGFFTENFLPLGDLKIKQDFGHKARVVDYKRILQLDKAIASIEFVVDEVHYTRKMFTSAPDSVMVIQFTADKLRKLTLDIHLTSLLKHHVTANGKDLFVLSGQAPACVDPIYYERPGREPIVQVDKDGLQGMRFQTVLKAIPDGGTIVSDEKGIHVKDANSLTLLLSAATSFNGFNKHPDSEGKDEKVISCHRIDRIDKVDFAVLKKRHITDFKSYFDRVSLHLTDTLNSTINKKLPTDFRLKLYSYGNYDPQLEELYFQYGRYLLISASRPGGSAINLQGLWSNEVRPPWASNYTININTEMNYWLAESTNLSEMHQSLLNFIKNLSITGEDTAKEYYHARGWMAHHNSDIWALSNSVGNCGDGNPSWASWYMGGNWLSLHLWEHYCYTGDKEFLKNEAYPIMKGAALFCFDWLLEKNGYLITSPSTSPENNFFVDNNVYAVSEAATMDMAIIHDLFTNVIEASEILGIDKKFRSEVIKKKERLFPYQIGSFGQLQEWSKDYKETDMNHRHLSHLFGVYPGRQISPLITPELAKAVSRTLELRGDKGTGWSKAWKICLIARLLDGNHAYKMIREMLQYSTYANLFNSCPPFQIDGNFGATAGFVEMLLQSQLKEIHLLPALPDNWPSGCILGLKSRGNFEVAIAWKNHQLKQAEIKSNLGNKCVLRTSVPVRVKGTVSTQVQDGNYYINMFDTQKGSTYLVEVDL